MNKKEKNENRIDISTIIGCGLTTASSMFLGNMLRKKVNESEEFTDKTKSLLCYGIDAVVLSLTFGCAHVSMKRVEKIDRDTINFYKEANTKLLKELKDVDDLIKTNVEFEVERRFEDYSNQLKDIVEIAFSKEKIERDNNKQTNTQHKLVTKATSESDYQEKLRKQYRANNSEIAGDED